VVCHGWQARWLLWRHQRHLPDLSPDAIASYQRFRGLSVNRANLLRLQHDRVMRPEELQGLLRSWLASAEPSPALAALLSETMNDAPGLLLTPATWQRPQVRDLGEAQLRWYRRGATGQAQARRLVVAFTSNANALTMMGPCFLQQLAPFATDAVLVLRAKPQHCSFFGADGSASLLAQLLRALADLVPLGAYEEVVTIGYSGGGFAALVAAMGIGADRGVSLGGAPPGRGKLTDPAWLAALRSALPPPRPAVPHLLLCCGRDCSNDVEATRLAEASLQCWPLPAAAIQSRAYDGFRDHNLLVEMQMRGYALRPVLADLMFPHDRRQHRRPPLSRRVRWRPLPPQADRPCAASF
jgi:hypothetical protein